MTTHLRHSLPVLALLGLLSASARADDTRPPQISNVNAGHKGTKVTITAKITDETGVLQARCHYRQQGGGSYEEAQMVAKGDDKFQCDFNASGTIEFYLASMDELGNGPSKSEVKTLNVSGKGKAIASDEKPKKKGKRKKVAKAEKPEEKPAEEAKPEEKPAEEAKGPPTVEHEKPAEATEGQATALKVKITGNKIAKATGWFRSLGQAKFAAGVPLAQKEGDDWEVEVPANLAKGTLEYIFIVYDEKNQKTQQGDGGQDKPFQLVFKKAKGAGDLAFAHRAVIRFSPGVAIPVRVQYTPASEAETPNKAMVLFRGKDGGDGSAELQPDDSGGIGGFAGAIPAQNDGAFYYQIVACKDAKCAVDTGSKKAWHAVAISTDAEAKQPDAIDAVSAKAPEGLPE